MEALPVPLVCCDLCTCNKATPTSKQASQPSQGEDSNKQQLAWRRWACAADASKTVYACLICSTHFTSAILAIKCTACSCRLHGCSFQADGSIRQPIALEKKGLSAPDRYAFTYPQSRMTHRSCTRIQKHALHCLYM